MAFTEFPDDWLEWLGDCMMMQVPHENIASYLVSRGFDAEVVEHYIKEAANHPFVWAGLKIARDMKRRDWLLKLYQTIQNNSPYVETIERRATVNRDEFYRHYHANNRPVILTDMIEDWEILKRWTPEYFKSHYGDRAVQVTYMNDTFDRSYPVMPMSAYVDTIQRPESANHWYMTNANTPYNENVIADLHGEVDRLPELLNPEGENPNGWILFGPKGNRTDLHFDLANALYAQIYGRKHFKIISPLDLPYVYPDEDFMSLVDLDEVDYERFELFKQAKVYDFILEPGEMLYLPIGWWHYVVSLDVAISISFSNFYSKEGYYYYSDLYGQSPLPQKV